MGPRDYSSNDRSTEQFRKLFIGGLTTDTKEVDLRNFYGQWGEIVDAVVMVNKSTGRSRGFGFITYSEPEMVDVAQSNRPHEINGRVVEAKRATPREESDNKASHQAVNRLFIGGLKKELTTDSLKEYFATFGNVTDVDIPKSKDTGEPRGFCFISFDDYDPVDKAVLQKRHTVNGVTFDVKKALDKNQMSNSRRENSSYPPHSRGSYRGPEGYDGFDPYGYSGDPRGYDRYGGPGYPQAPSYDDRYGNGWSDPSYSYGSFGSYDDQGYRGGPMRDRSGYGSESYGGRSQPYSGRGGSRGGRR